MDDEPDWLSAADEPEPEPAPAAAGKPADAAKAEAGEAPAEGGEPGEEPGEAPPEEASDEYLDPDKLLLFKHWIRPKFLPYKYLYYYRHNYYDDVIDYLDKRNRGITRDIPVAQTWAERALRYYTKNCNSTEFFRSQRETRKFVEESKYTGKFHLHHGKTYLNQKFSRILL